MTSLVLFLLIGVSQCLRSENMLYRVPSTKSSKTLPKFESSIAIIKWTPANAATIDKSETVRTQQVSSTAPFSIETENNAALIVYTDYLNPFHLCKFLPPSFYPFPFLQTPPDNLISFQFIDVYPKTEDDPHITIPYPVSLRYCSLPLYNPVNKYPTGRNKRSIHIHSSNEPLNSYLLVRRVPDGISHNLGTSEGLIEPTFVQNPLPSAQPIFPFSPIDSVNAPVVVNIK